MTAPLAQGLAALEAELRALLSCLESDPPPRVQVLDDCGRRVQQAFEAVRAAHPDRTEVAREPVERCQRLHALATELLARRRAQLTQQREACTGLRGRLRRTRTGAEPSGSCDVSA